MGGWWKEHGPRYGNSFESGGDKTGTSVDERELARELGLLEAVTIGIGGIIGGAIYSVLGIVMEVAGPAVILSFLLCAFTALMVGYNYAKLGESYPSSGASYEYVARAFPRHGLVKGLVGYSLWLGYLVACSFYSVSFGFYANHFFPSVPARVFSVTLIVAFLALNLAGVGKTGKTQDILVLVKVGILALFVALGIPSVKPGYYHPFFPKGVLSTFTASALIFIGYEGFEIIGTAGEELRNPKRDLRRAVYVTIAIVSSLYLMVAFVAVGLIPYDELGASGAPLAELASLVLGRWGGLILGFGALLSTSSALSAALFGSSRLAYAMAREGMMPHLFSSLNKRTRAPQYGLMVASLIIVFITMLGVVRELSGLASLIFLVAFFLVSLSNFRLREKTRSNVFYPFLAMFLCSYFMLFVERAIWIEFIILIAAAIILPQVMRRHISKTPQRKGQGEAAH